MVAEIQQLKLPNTVSMSVIETIMQFACSFAIWLALYVLGQGVYKRSYEKAGLGIQSQQVNIQELFYLSVVIVHCIHSFDSVPVNA